MYFNLYPLDNNENILNDCYEKYERSELRLQLKNFVTGADMHKCVI